MRLLPASLALLGVEVAMAAIAAPRRTDHAQSTRPRAALGVQETWRIAQADPTAAANAATTQLQRLEAQEGQPAAAEGELIWHQEAKRQDSMSGSSAGPVTTELGYFTAGGGVYSVSSLNGGLNVVAGKTVTVGGPDALVGGAEVSAAQSGLFVNGVEVMFETVTISASASMSMSMSSGVAGMSSAGPSASASGAAPSQSSSGNGAAVPLATAGAGVMAAVGAVVGVLVL